MSTDLDFMRRHVECPICTDIPRDGVMLTCCNGHNVCATCKNRLVRPARCPQGRCAFTVPPTRNLTVANIIGSLPFEFSCRFAKADDVDASGCGIRGTDAALRIHEAVCEYRPVPCPACGQPVPANDVVKHYASVHKVSPRGKRAKDPNVVKMYCLWKEKYDESAEGSVGWSGRPSEVSAGWMLPCAGLRNGTVFLWLQMIAPFDVTETLKCVITLGTSDYPLGFVAPVYPVDWTRDRIMEDADCARLEESMIAKVLTEDITEAEREAGHSARFKVTFKTVKNNASCSMQ